MKDILLTVSVVAITTALFRMLVPEGSFGKQIAFLITCFFLVTAVNSISGNIDIDFSPIYTDEGGYLDLTEETNEKAKQLIADEMKSEINALLIENGFHPYKTYITVNISEYSSISISEVRLVFLNSTDEEIESARALIQNEVGDDITVVSEND